MTTSSDPASLVSPPAPPATSPPAHAAAWSAWQRFLFRYAAFHWFLYALPGLLDHFLATLSRGLVAVNKTWPALGIDATRSPWNWPDRCGKALRMVDDPAVLSPEGVETGGHGWWQEVTTWLWQNDWTPWQVIQQPTGSSDTAHDWVRVGVIALVSLLSAAMWTTVARAEHYPRLWRWLHLLVRFGLGFTMLSYGLDKFCVGQFGELELTRLTQDIGDTTPMALVGTLQQANRPYELFGGGGEVLGGLLLFHRRTALLGAGVTIVVMTNVCALNWLCGVPVKQYSTHLLLFAFGLLGPFRARLWALFASNRPSAPVDLAVVRTRWLAWTLVLVGGVWVASSLYFDVVDRTRQHEEFMKGREKSPLHGCWLVEQMRLDGVEVPIADATRWRYLAIDRGREAWAEEATGGRVFFDFALDAAGATASVQRRGATAGEPAVWTCELGRKVVPVDVPLWERPAVRQRKVDGERRTLVLRGALDGKPFALHTVEKQFRLPTGFRLRQELPEGW